MAAAGGLRELRERAGLTQTGLAHLVGVRQATVIRWEKRTNEPSASTIRRLAHVLRCSESDVIEAIIGIKQAS